MIVGFQGLFVVAGAFVEGAELEEGFDAGDGEGPAVVLVEPHDRRDVRFRLAWLAGHWAQAATRADFPGGQLSVLVGLLLGAVDDQLHGGAFVSAGQLSQHERAVRRAAHVRACGLMARIHDIVVDCRHPASLARFWAAVLDDYQVAPYDEVELDRLRSDGIDDPEDDPNVLVEAGPGVRPRFFFSLVPESKVVKNRMHLDLTADHPAAEVRRLVGLGARVLAEHEDWVTMADPEGNEFFVMR